MGVVTAVVMLVRAMVVSRATVTAENLALRHQLGVLQRFVKRPELRRRDRFFWVWLSRLGPAWRESLAIVRPETVIGWHREGFRLYWRWVAFPPPRGYSHSTHQNWSSVVPNGLKWSGAASRKPCENRVYGVSSS